MSKKELENLLNNIEVPEGICKKGCSLCCYQSVELFDFEVDRIVNYINKNNIVPDNFKFLRLYKRFLYGERDISELIETRVKCSFLKNGECQIYLVRPSACRIHYQESEIELCKNYKRNTAFDKSFFNDFYKVNPVVEFTLLNGLPQILKVTPFKELFII